MITYKGQSAESNVPTAGKGATPGKLDFRFADEEDAKEIVQCVASAFQVEYDKESVLYNRRRGWGEAPVISEEQVEKDCWSANLRWIVLETPLPDEIVVSAARMSMAAVMAGDRSATTTSLSASCEKPVGHILHSWPTGTRSTLEPAKLIAAIAASPVGCGCRQRIP